MHDHYTTVLKYFALVKKHISDSAIFNRHINAWLKYDANDLLAAAITGYFFDNKSINVPQKIIAIYREIDSLNLIYLDKLQSYYGALYTVMQVMKATLEPDEV